MTEIETALEEGAGLLDKLAVLLVFPALLSVVNLGELETVLSQRGADQFIGITFPFPVAIGDLWVYVDTPTAGSTLNYGSAGAVGTGTGAGTLLAIVLYLVIYGIVAAGYLGSIQQYRRERQYDFGANIQRYGATFVGLSLAIFGGMALVVLFAAAIPALFILALPGILLVWYLFWGACFLVPVADMPAVEALGGSYRLALNERTYAVWTLAHVAIGAVLSLVGSGIVFAGAPSLLGVLLGLIIVLPVGFILTAASLRIIDDLTNGQSPGEGMGPGYGIDDTHTSAGGKTGTNDDEEPAWG